MSNPGWLERGGTYSIDFFDSGVVRECDVDAFVEEFTRSRLPDEEPDIVKCGGGPREENEESDAGGSDRVEIPDESISDNGHDETENVHGQIVSMVDEEDMCCWVSSQGETV